jgi:phosphoribosylformylglycinamidine cyclo-ligase
VIDEEMYRTFNNGIGMVIVVAEQDAVETLSVLADLGEAAYQIGYIKDSEQATPSVIINK